MGVTSCLVHISQSRALSTRKAMKCRNVYSQRIVQIVGRKRQSIASSI